jgi:hypothetical protein
MESERNQEKGRTMRNRLNLRRLPHRLIRLETTLGVDKVGSEDGVDEGRLAETGLTCGKGEGERRERKGRGKGKRGGEVG